MPRRGESHYADADIAREFKSLRPDIKKALPKPITKVWRWNK
jgi:hypothetical protein